MKLSSLRKCCLAGITGLIFGNPSFAQKIGGLPNDIILEKPFTEKDFPIVSTERSASGIRFDNKDLKGVLRAIGDLRNDIDSVTGIKPFFSCTLPFRKDGQSISATFDDAKETKWNINEELTWKNNYTKMYPAGAARMIETITTLELPLTADGVHILQIRPLDPGVVINKIIVDAGGYEQTYLKMEESPYKKSEKLNK